MDGAVEDGGFEAGQRRAGGDAEVAVQNGRTGVGDGRAAEDDERTRGCKVDLGGLRGCRDGGKGASDG
jgi:hypothetical protein